VSKINHYPTFQSFVNGHEISIDPERKVNTILELVDKLLSPNIIKLESDNEIQTFSKDYGENAFILYDNSHTSPFYKCVNKIAGELYKADLYFGYVDLNSYNSTIVQGKRLKVF